MKWLKKVVLTLFALLFLFATGVSLFIWKYEEEIKQMVIQSVNQNLKTEIAVKKIDLTFWNTFPRVSVNFHEALIKAVNAKNDTLLSAKQLSAQFNAIDLYRGKYRLSSLKVEEAFCQLQVDHSGYANYLFWESDSTSESDFQLDLESVSFSNTTFNYLDYQKDLELRFYIESAKLKGAFSALNYQLSLDAKMPKALIRNGPVVFVDNRTMLLKGNANINGEEKKIDFQEVSLALDGIDFFTKGSVSYQNELLLKLALKCPKAELKNAVALLPESIRKQLAEYDLSGEVKLEGSINGPLSAIDQPSYQASFKVNEASFKHKASGFIFNNTAVEGTIDNGAANTLESSKLVLSKLSTETKEGQIAGKLSLSNFTSPLLVFDGSLQLSLLNLQAFIDEKDLQLLGGKVKANFSWKAKLNKVHEFTLNDWKRSSLEGEADLTAVAFKLPRFKNEVRQLNGKLNLNKNNISTERLSFDFGAQSITGALNVNNLFAYLTEKEQELIIDAKLNANTIQAEDFIPQLSEETGSNSAKGPIRLYLDAEIDTLNYQQHSIEQFSGIATYKTGRFDLRGANFNYLEGKLTGDFFIRKATDGTYKTYAQAVVDRADLKSLFTQFKNFDQTTLRAENLSGRVSTNLSYSANYTEKWELIKSSLKVDAEVLVEKGELLDFKPLENLSSYIELEELKQVKFKNLQNQISIQNETIFIPKFEIESTALNLKLEGQHHFDQNIDYRFELLLNEVLGKKVKKPENNEFGYIEDDGLGRTKVFMRMRGTVDQPTFSYDKEQLKNHIKSKVQAEKQSVKSILKEEFGLFKKDSLPAYKPSQKKSKSPFSIEIEELESEKAAEKAIDSSNRKKEDPKKDRKKSKLGKFIDKIAQPNEDEFVEPKEN